MEKLHHDFREKDTEVLMIYCREPHPGARYPQPTTYEERAGHARAFKELHGVHYNIVVDDMDSAIQNLYGNLPNMAYVIDKRGIIVYKASWCRPTEISEVLESLWQRERLREKGLRVQSVISERVIYRGEEETLALEKTSVEVLGRAEAQGELERIYGDYAKTMRERSG